LLGQVEAAGDRFVAVVDPEEGPARLASSLDGESWEYGDQALPFDGWADFQTFDQWTVVWNEEHEFDPTTPWRGPESSELWATDDYGDSWRALGTVTMSAFDIPPDPDGFFVVSSLSVGQVAMVDDTVVALVSVDPDLNLQAVAESHGHTADLRQAHSVGGDSSGTITVVFCSVGPVPSDDDTCSGDYQEVSFTSPWYAEHSGFGGGHPFTQLLVSTDGGPFESVSGFPGEPMAYDRLTVRQGRFHLLGEAGFFVSDDGATWTAVGNPTPLADVVAFGQSGLAGTSDERTLAYSTDGGTTWATEPIPVRVARAADGPGGLVLVGTPHAYSSTPASIVRFVQELAGVDPEAPWHIGWSPDGETWSWQPATEVFAITPLWEFPTATVGRDRILVRLSHGSDERWYVADVPDRDG
jgi:hypothetical protein